jgi:replication factor A1
MNSNIDDIYQALLDLGLTEEKIEREVQKKAHSLGNMMAPSAVLFLVAKDLGLSFSGGEIESFNIGMDSDDIDYDEFALDINEIEEGMSAIVVVGRIERVYPIREFLRKDGTNGTVGSFFINDGTGRIKIVLWDQQVEVMKNDFFIFNEIVRIIGGYSKVGLNEKLEIYLGKKGEMELAPSSSEKSKKIPLLLHEYIDKGEISLKNISISEVYEKDGFIPFVLGVVHVEEFSEKDLKNGEKNFLIRFLLSDDDNSIEVVAWGKDALNTLRQINDGDEIQLSNVIIKLNSYTGKKQLQFTKRTILNVL